ncbi:hypothetical protein CSUI_001019 [Cystoisospora suis]|uniref:Uncharacterized protein n=1 Tax=Cystoisospora suis TaxID=483139 RepID=A0A2C6LEM4_9APIC|nr:hypothetical protein CSUI_001019 [Cystoisospora suis]
MYSPSRLRRRPPLLSESFDQGKSPHFSPVHTHPPYALTIQREQEPRKKRSPVRRRRWMEECQDIGEDEAFKPPPTFLDKCDESQRFSTEITTPLSVLMPRLARNRGGTLDGSFLRRKAVSPSAKSPYPESRLSRDNRDPPTTYSPTSPSSTRPAVRSTLQSKNGLESPDISSTFEGLKVSFHPKSQRLKECYSTSPTSPPDNDNVTARHRSSPHARPMLSRVSPTPSGFLSSSPCSISPSPVQKGTRDQTEESLESRIPNLPPIPGVRVSPFFPPVLAASPSPSSHQGGGGTSGSPFPLSGPRPSHSLRCLPEKASLQGNRHSQEDEEETLQGQLLMGAGSRGGTRVSPRTDSIQCIPLKVSVSPIGGFRKCSARQHARPPSVIEVPQTSCTTSPRPSTTYSRGGLEPMDYSTKGNGDARELRESESATHTLDYPGGRRGLTSDRGGSEGEGRQSPSDRELLLELLNHGESVSPAAFVKLRQSLNRAKKSKGVDSLKDWTDTSKITDVSELQRENRLLKVWIACMELLPYPKACDDRLLTQQLLAVEADRCLLSQQVSEEERAIRRLQTEKQQLRLLLLEARGGGWAEKRTQEAVQVAEERLKAAQRAVVREMTETFEAERIKNIRRLAELEEKLKVAEVAEQEAVARATALEIELSECRVQVTELQTVCEAKQTEVVEVTRRLQLQVKEKEKEVDTVKERHAHEERRWASEKERVAAELAQARGELASLQKTVEEDDRAREAEKAGEIERQLKAQEDLAKFKQLISQELQEAVSAKENLERDLIVARQLQETNQEGARSSEKQLQEKVAELHQKLARTEDQSKKAEEEIAVTKKELEAANEEIVSMRKALGQATEESACVRKKLDHSNEETAQALGQFACVKKELDEANEELACVKKELEEAQIVITKVREEKEEVELRRQQVEEELQILLDAQRTPVLSRAASVEDGELGKSPRPRTSDRRRQQQLMKLRKAEDAALFKATLAAHRAGIAPHVINYDRQVLDKLDFANAGKTRRRARAGETSSVLDSMQTLSKSLQSRSLETASESVGEGVPGRSEEDNSQGSGATGDSGTDEKKGMRPRGVERLDIGRLSQSGSPLNSESNLPSARRLSARSPRGAPEGFFLDRVSASVEAVRDKRRQSANVSNVEALDLVADKKGDQEDSVPGTPSQSSVSAVPGGGIERGSAKSAGEGKLSGNHIVSKEGSSLLTGTEDNTLKASTVERTGFTTPASSSPPSDIQGLLGKKEKSLPLPTAKKGLPSPPQPKTSSTRLGSPETKGDVTPDAERIDTPLVNVKTETNNATASKKGVPPPSKKAKSPASPSTSKTPEARVMPDANSQAEQSQASLEVPGSKAKAGKLGRATPVKTKSLGESPITKKQPLPKVQAVPASCDDGRTAADTSSEPGPQEVEPTEERPADLRDWEAEQPSPGGTDEVGKKVGLSPSSLPSGKKGSALSKKTPALPAAKNVSTDPANSGPVGAGERHQLGPDGLGQKDRLASSSVKPPSVAPGTPVPDAAVRVKGTLPSLNKVPLPKKMGGLPPPADGQSEAKASKGPGTSPDSAEQKDNVPENADAGGKKAGPRPPPLPPKKAGVVRAEPSSREGSSTPADREGGPEGGTEDTANGEAAKDAPAAGHKKAPPLPGGPKAGGGNKKAMPPDPVTKKEGTPVSMTESDSVSGGADEQEKENGPVPGPLGKKGLPPPTKKGSLPKKMGGLPPPADGQSEAKASEAGLEGEATVASQAGQPGSGGPTRGPSKGTPSSTAPPSKKSPPPPALKSGKGGLPSSLPARTSSRSGGSGEGLSAQGEEKDVLTSQGQASGDRGADGTDCQVDEEAAMLEYKRMSSYARFKKYGPMPKPFRPRLYLKSKEQGLPRANSGPDSK